MYPTGCQTPATHDCSDDPKSPVKLSALAMRALAAAHDIDTNLSRIDERLFGPHPALATQGAGENVKNPQPPFLEELLFILAGNLERMAKESVHVFERIG